MRRRVSILCLCFAWVCANGAASHTAQVFALGQLLINFSHHLPAAQAFVKTCDDRELCPICLAIEQAKEDARNHPLPSENMNEQKLVMACLIMSPLCLTREMQSLLPGCDLSGLLRTEPVPMQPPRELT